MRKPGIRTGALVGVLLTAPLIAVFFVATRLFGLPFVPFDLFDWLARVLPGPLVTFGIDAMVDAIRALELGAVSDLAKTAEQAMAVAIFLLLGVLAGAVLFAVLRARRRGSGIAAGLALGAGFALALFPISTSLNQTATAPPLASGLWLALALLAWGAAFGWSYGRLGGSAPAASPEPAAPSAERIDRRRFLVRMGGSAAIITVAGASVGALLGEGRRRAPSATATEP